MACPYPASVLSEIREEGLFFVFDFVCKTILKALLVLGKKTSKMHYQ